MDLVDGLGFDSIDAGTIDESWRQQPGTPVYGADLDATGVEQALTEASPERPKTSAADAKKGKSVCCGRVAAAGDSGADRTRASRGWGSCRPASWDEFCADSAQRTEAAMDSSRNSSAQSAHSPCAFRGDLRSSHGQLYRIVGRCRLHPREG